MQMHARALAAWCEARAHSYMCQHNSVFHESINFGARIQVVVFENDIEKFTSALHIQITKKYKKNYLMLVRKLSTVFTSFLDVQSNAFT